MPDLEYLYITWFYPDLCPLIYLLLLCLTALINCNFWVSLSKFIQESFHFLGYIFKAIPALFPSLFLSLLLSLFSKTLAVVSLLFHFPAGLPTTFSPSVVAILCLLFLIYKQVFFSISFVFGNKYTNAQLSA